MNLFFDTSALIKKYIEETGSDIVDDLLDKAESVYVSSITEIEVFSTFKRLLVEKAITENDYKILKADFKFDFQFFTAVRFDDFITEKAKAVIEKYQLKSLDSIQLSSALFLKDEIDYFIGCDEKLIKAGRREGLKIRNPVW